ncbi:MAG: amino acid adenylation domain-containing protein [Ardenticatenaceae bacterium]|nr:amino acid adenylation domain-containing protein [Ardenticatenaceae bacterium]
MNVINTKNASLPERFAVQVHQSPDALAVFTQEDQLTFAELNGRANQLARLLQQQGVGVEAIVGVCLERSVEMVIALLAVLKAGAAYVPIDPAYPPERIEYMLADAETAVCLTHSQLAYKLPETAQGQTIFLDQSDYVLSLLASDDLPVTVQPDNLAYIIYTSGSTGKPKGAMITHGGLANYLDWALDAYPAQSGGAPVHSSIGFDLTVTSLFVPLLAGQTVHLLPEGDAGTLLGQALAETAEFGLVKITPAHLLLLNQIIPAEQAAGATHAFVIGGEQLTAEQLAFWRKHAPNTRLFNEYGPTETVVGCCVYEILPEDALNGAVPIGQPIANTQLYVLDEQMQPVPEGEVGELFIGGAGVARGYLKRPSLTAEKFVPDPFSEVPGARLYRTGDLARLRPDGNFEFLGRIDHQVKIRGYRIELGEIEAVLGQHENVRETAVLVHETSGSKQLIAYLTAEQTPAPVAEDLRAFLAQRLPEYMIPARFIVLEAMPLTINGKIDRQALPAPESARPELPQPYAPPRSSQEETLANIWSDVLGVSPIGIHDSFFGLGGDSILGIQIVAKARAAGFDLSQAQLFQQPTVAELATAVSAAPISQAVAETPLLNDTEQAQLRVEFGEQFETAYPLSPLQEGILFHTLLHPEDDIYFEQPAFTIEGALQPDLLLQAWQQVAARHPILRTIFVWDGWERPLQIVLKQVAPRTQLLDWRHLNAADQASQMAKFMAENEAAGLPLAQPPHHLTLIRLSEQETRFIWTVHHIIIDGWTESLLYKDLFAIYEALVQGETAVLPEPEPFETFVRWQQQQDWADAQPFWQEALAGFAVPTPLTIDLGKHATRHRVQTQGELRRQLPVELHEALKQFSRTHGLTLGTLLQAAWGLLLSRYSGEPDVVFGTMMSGRVPQLPGVDQIAGVLINPVPLRCQITPEDTVLPWLRQFQSNLLALQAHETTPLVQVQSWSELSADQPLFESLLVLENYPRQRKAAGGQLTIRDYFSYERTNYPLTLRLVPDEALDVFLVFDADRLAETAVSRLFDHYCNLLKGMVADAERPLAQLPLITEAEAQQLIFEWNEWDTSFASTSCIHQEFEQQVAKNPDAIAVKFGGQQLTYAQLNAKANQLAHFLQHTGVQPDDLVALYLERSLEMVIAILGVLKAGGAYLPMDTVYPEDRLAFMLDDAQPAACLTTHALAAKLHAPVAHTILLDADWSQIAKSPATNPISAVQPNNRAYVIYTSGSTGKPKGVLVTHANVMRLMQATDDWYHFDQNDVWTLFHSYAFDFSVWEIWGALLYGGRLIVVPYLTSRSPHDFYQLLVAEGVTVLNQTPSAFRQLIQAEAEVGQADNLALRYVIFGGEALELNTLQPWFDRHGDQKPQLINMYGITETTVHVTYRPIYSNDVAQAPGSVIGRAIPDLQLYILDPQQQPVPIGVPGEIYVGGAGVAAGYLNRPELTAERFLPLSVIGHPLSIDRTRSGRAATLPVTDDRLPNTVYRTGDLARWLPDGDIEYLGRIDHQVKIRGFRIELGEIEAALGGHTAVHQVLVLVREDEPGEKRLVAYLVLDPDQPVTVSDLRSYVQPKLPVYMIPAAFVLLDAFPLTNNGKIDRRALPEPDEARPELERPYTPPRSRAEEILAEIWSRVLNVARVGIDDNYFELGGDSIRSIQILAQSKQAGLNFSLADLFNLQTIGRLSEQMARIELVEAGVSAIDVAAFSLIDKADRAALPPNVEDAYPLSKLQAGMLFHAELAAETAVYHNVTSWQIEAPFDAAKLELAVQQLSQKHTVLRTSIDLTSYSEPLQLVWPQVEIPVTLHDLRPLAIEAQEAELDRWVQQTIAHKFDWTQPPLLRFHFFQRSETTFQMIMAEHHAILDGWSVASLVTELFQTYSALLRGNPITPATAVPYREFVAAEQRTLASKTTRTFWQEMLAESNVSQVPRLSMPKTEADLPETAVHQTILTTEQVAQLSHVALQAGVPLKSVLLAAHLKVLGSVSGQRDVLSGLVMNGRTEHNGSERALGLFLNTVPFRQKMAAGSWLDLIRQTFATEKTILPYRRFPLAEIQQTLGGQPLFEVPFNYLHFHVFDELAHQAQVKIADEQFYGHANFALAVEAELNPANGTLALRLEYKPAEFGAAQIERLAGYYRRTLAALVAEPDAAHESFSVLSETERQLLLHDWNTTETAVPHQLIHEWVAQVAEAMGERTAVIFNNQQLTYAELNAKANQLAHYLQASGVGPETLVAVYLDRSLEMVIAALAVLKAGGAYLPLDTTYPAERINFMLADAKAAFVLTREALRAPLNDLRYRLEAPHPTLIALDSDWPKIALCSEQNPDSGVAAENAAYIIYTSGSTGQPKGVVVTHRGVPNLAQAQHQAFGIGPDSRVLQFAAFGFDASVSEMFVTLTAGATLVLAEAEAMLPGPDLVALVRDQNVTAVTLPPSALAILNPVEFPSLQTVVAAGEACSTEIAAKWSEGRRFVNGYGPTEATVCATTAVLTPADTQVHIGRPLDNVQLYILNENQQPVPLGTPGELYIGGIGVARGYLNRPELTAERFVPLPGISQNELDTEHGSLKTVYRTGDLVRYLPDGNIEFLGRLDHQVKIRGYRIELGEIETVLRRQTAVLDALVLARDDAGTGPQLVAYVVGPHASVADLRTALSQRLPAYMVPAAFVQLDAFPLTPNGKIDRKALPAPVATAVAQYVAPRNDVETVIANLWAETLKLPRVGIHDNFFELGGHSLLATQLVTRLRQTLRIELSLRALFDSPTVADIATVALQPPNNRSHVEKVAQLLIKLSQLSEEEAAKLLSQKR